MRRARSSPARTARFRFGLTPLLPASRAQLPCPSSGCTAAASTLAGSTSRRLTKWRSPWPAPGSR
ncbi:hypothetical protein ACFPRL_21190 [Pseudoclavibacter helvolus]